MEGTYPAPGERETNDRSKLYPSSHLWVDDLFEGEIGPDGEGASLVLGDRDARVSALLQDVLPDAIGGSQVPLIHGAVDAARHHGQVVIGPHQTLHSVAVTLEVADVVESHRGINLNYASIDGSQLVSAVTESTLTTQHIKHIQGGGPVGAAGIYPHLSSRRKGTSSARGYFHTLYFQHQRQNIIVS